jgi:hypothetical protein
MTGPSRRELLVRAGAPFLLQAVRHGDLPDPEFDVRTFFMSWGNTTTPEFYRFLDDVKPELVLAGFYGPMFHGYADNPASTGYMMRLPVPGQRVPSGDSAPFRLAWIDLALAPAGGMHSVSNPGPPASWCSQSSRRLPARSSLR